MLNEASGSEIRRQPGSSESRTHFQLAECVWGRCSAVPSVVFGVQFVGVKRTVRDALLREVSGIFQSKNLDELIRNAHICADHMTEIGIFDSVLPLVDVAKSGANNAFDVMFLVREPTPFKFAVKANCQVPTGTPELLFDFVRSSVFGRGETLSASYSRSTKGGVSFDVGASKPFPGWQKHSSVLGSLFRAHRFLDWNRADLTETGLFFQFKKEYGRERSILQHLRLNAAWRQFMPVKNTPFAVREHAGHTTKFSVEHQIALDTRDCTIIPTKGIFARHTIEYAGLLGDSSFLRNALDLQLAAPLLGDLFGSASLRVEGTQSIGRRSLHLLDRLYLGGPYNLRGFSPNSVSGAQAEDNQSSLGGMFALSGALHLYHPLPQPKGMLFAHGFIVGGSVAPVRSRRWLSDVLNTPRVSAGVGLVGVLGPIRLELNYTVPLRYIRSDRVSSGIQLGVGGEFF